MRLARIEWAFLPVLDRETSQVRPDTLVSAIASEPQFFVDLLVSVYRGKNDPPREQPMSEKEQLLARRAHELLDGPMELPGTTESNRLDYGHLADWLERVRGLAHNADRLEVCDLTVGKLVGRATATKKIPEWPANELARLMEAIGTEELFHGFMNGVINSRGITSRDPRDGGKQERALAQQYRDFAQVARPASARLAAAFLDLAKYYDNYARREDEDAERVRLGR